jgi:Uma2 family endonuclease
MSEPQPAWQIAYLFPPQGHWSEEEYLALNGNRMVEFSNGHVEVLPLPKTSHQLLVAHLYGLLLAFAAARDLGTVLFAPLRVRLWRGKYREPDVVFMLNKHADRMGEEYWDGADLVMEVVSEDNEDRRRDLDTKRREYARRHCRVLDCGSEGRAHHGASICRQALRRPRRVFRGDGGGFPLASGIHRGRGRRLQPKCFSVLWDQEGGQAWAVTSAMARAGDSPPVAGTGPARQRLHPDLRPRIVSPGPGRTPRPRGSVAPGCSAVAWHLLSIARGRKRPCRRGPPLEMPVPW